MNLAQITQAANVYTDENFNVNISQVYANEAIARINIELKTKLPSFLEATSDDYTALPEKWIRTVIVPYVSYSIKMNDGSLNEADRFLQQFNQGLFSLKNNKHIVITENYQDTGFKNGYKIKPYSNWF
jgi:hypothetical protein